MEKPKSKVQEWTGAKEKKKKKKQHIMFFIGYHISSILTHLISKHILQIKSIKRTDFWQVYAN